MDASLGRTISSLSASGGRLPASGILLALALGGALALAGCAAEAPSVIRTTSNPKGPPSWLVKPPQEPGMLYFSGSREGAESLDDGKAAATDRARDEAAKFIGVAITSEHTDVMSSDLASDKIRDQVKSRAAALIRNAQVADVYWEKNSRSAGVTTIDRYDVSVLLKLPKAELEKERERQEAEGKETARASLSRMREGQAQEQAGNILAALARYRDVVSTLKPMATNIETGDASLPSSGALRQAAEDAASKAQAKARRAILVAPDWVAGAITQALSAKGFSAQARSGITEQDAVAQARREGLPWVIVARAQTTPGGKVFAQVAATASLDVRALDSQSGAVVASAQKSAKAVARTPEAAANDAASEAGAAAGNELAAALVAKENTGL